MNTQISRKIEMGARVRTFIQAHAVDGEGFANARTAFERLLVRAEELASQQLGGLVAARVASARRREIRQGLHFGLLRHLAGVGTVAGRTQAELAVQLKLPRINATHQAFLTTVKAMLSKAEPQKDLLVTRGMSETLLTDLGQAVAEFEAANETSRAARRDHVGASADLERISVEIQEYVRLLDGLIRYKFGENRELMAAWESARHLPGPSAGKGPAEQPGHPPVIGPATPPAPGGIAPAA